MSTLTKRTTCQIQSCFLILFLLVLPSLAFAAEEATQQPQEETGRFLPPIETEVYGAFISKSDMDDSSASFSQQNYGIKVASEFFYMEFEQAHFDWSNGNDLGFGRAGAKNPWDTLNSIAAGVSIPFDLSDSFFLQTNLAIATSFEDEITSDSFEFGGISMLGYKLNDHWTFFAGVALSKDPLEWNFAPLGFVKFNYDAWEVSLGFPRTYVHYAFNDQWAVRTKLDAFGGTYKLSSSSTVEKNGYVDINNNIVGAYVLWTPVENFLLTAGPEFYFNRSIRIYDDGGHKVGGKSNPDDAWGGSLTLAYEF